ncbi:hypothetical protein [Taklimakanibacter deserti]|uniref:TubC N-terminal docking domain-related protein n=1 Tax=Taklimakanibacter deserti TaxID=2267839 RepID=UPI000E651544
MIASAELIRELSNLGIHLELSGGQLILDGPEKLVTDTVIARIRANKPEIIAHLQKTSKWTLGDWRAWFNTRAAIAHGCGFEGTDAELCAFEDCIDRWLSCHPPTTTTTTDGICIQCRCQVDTADPSIIRIADIAKEGRFLHAGCAARWHNLRRWEARRALIQLLLAIKETKPVNTKRKDLANG